MIAPSLRQATTLILAMTVLTGLVYPMLVTGIALGVFPHQARGSLLSRNGKAIGSALIGQRFEDPRYFRGRLSATAPQPYNARASGGSNLGPLNPVLVKTVTSAAAGLRAMDHQNLRRIPVDLVTASASGLDPEITPAAAYFQAERVARERGLRTEQVRALIAQLTEAPSLAFLGESRVNVLKLNLALEQDK